MIERVTLPGDALQPITHGRFATICKNPALDKGLRHRYGRENVCLKLFNEPAWEGTTLEDATKVQNMAHYAGFAPRVYAVVQLDDGRYGQVTDYTPHVGTLPGVKWVQKLALWMMERGVMTRKTVAADIDDLKLDWQGLRNWADARLFLDWGGYYLRDPEGYVADLHTRARAHITGPHKGQPGEKGYQSLPGLGIAGDRDTDARRAVFRMDELPLTGADVLDIGCNLGTWCFEAAHRGARRVTGLDRDFIAEPMREVANWLGYYNLDFLAAKLPEGKPTEIYDVVFAFSVVNYFGGYAPWIADLTRKVLLLEGHGDETRETYQAALERDFARVEYLGVTTDVKERPVFRCWKA